MATNNIIARFIRAVAAGDEVSARQLCAPRAWHAQANSINQLFRQLRGRGRRLTLRVDSAPRVSESARAAVECAVIDQDSERLSELTLLHDHIPARLAGWTRSAMLVERYLSGLIPADMGLHTLAPDPEGLEVAMALAEDLARSTQGESAATERLAHRVVATGSAAAVIGHLRMRVTRGVELTVDEAYRLDVLDRLAVRARFSKRATRPVGDGFWLYAERAAEGGWRWFALRPLFDVDALLAY